MALNTRGPIDSRFSFAHRPVARGAMLSRVRVYRPAQKDLTDDVPEWNPFDPDAADRAPLGGSTFTAIYEGPGRVQPNQDWRARASSAREEVLTIHNTRVQLPFDGNELGAFPTILLGDVVRVLSVFSLAGVPTDPNLTDYAHIVGNIVPSSNSWVRTLACNTDMTTRVGVLDA
jgi:hypothetical protein